MTTFVRSAFVCNPSLACHMNARTREMSIYNSDIATKHRATLLDWFQRHFTQSLLGPSGTTEAAPSIDASEICEEFRRSIRTACARKQRTKTRMHGTNDRGRRKRKRTDKLITSHKHNVSCPDGRDFEGSDSPVALVSVAALRDSFRTAGRSSGGCGVLQ